MSTYNQDKKKPLLIVPLNRYSIFRVKPDEKIGFDTEKITFSSFGTNHMGTTVFRKKDGNTKMQRATFYLVDLLPHIEGFIAKLGIGNNEKFEDVLTVNRIKDNVSFTNSLVLGMSKDGVCYINVIAQGGETGKPFGWLPITGNEITSNGESIPMNVISSRLAISWCKNFINSANLCSDHIATKELKILGGEDVISSKSGSVPMPKETKDVTTSLEEDGDVSFF